MATGTKNVVKKKAPIDESAKDDPNAVHDVYSEEDLDTAYDENIADDIAFDYDGASKDPGDHETNRKKKK